VLSSLRIRNLAIIEDVELSLGPGLNVLTGETGAGKSILVTALELALGGKGSGDWVRTGCAQAEVDALFEHLDAEHTAQALAQIDLDEGEPSEPIEQLLVRRVVHQSGRTRAYVNGRLVTTAQLQRLAKGLADISSQHEHHTLTNPATHLAYLDAYASLGPYRSAMALGYEALRAAKAALDDLQRRSANRDARVEQLRAEVAELEAARLVSGEEQTLGTRAEVLRNMETLLRLSGGACDLLYDRDDSLMDQLLVARRHIADATKFDSKLAPIEAEIEAARRQLEDASRGLRRYVDSLSANPEELRQIEERAFVLSRIKRKYGGSVEAAVQHLAAALRELDTLQHLAESNAELLQRVATTTTEAAVTARELSHRRKLAADNLGAAIGAELKSLGMGDARVLIELAPLSGSGSDLEIDGSRLCSTGLDRAEFLIAPNLGEQARPLATVASGGELSRAMLAIKRVLAEVGPAGMYVFDEVDSGVGGAVAEVIGRKIRSVAQHRQVLCITHLAQIAVYADHHFQVRKCVIENRTQTQVKLLTSVEQTEEVARMLGGIRITKHTRAAAREMLKSAKDQAA
jgi:DNA repair protein RecN (Recombination protein N)